MKNVKIEDTNKKEEKKKRKKKKKQNKNCNICQKAFTTYQGHYLHTKKYHYHENELISKNILLGSEILKFKHTKQKTEDTNELKKKKNPIFNCKICHKTFRLNIILNNHYKKFHYNNQITQFNTDEKTPDTELENVKVTEKIINEESENADKNINVMIRDLSINLPPCRPSTCNPEDFPELYRR